MKPSATWKFIQAMRASRVGLIQARGFKFNPPASAATAGGSAPRRFLILPPWPVLKSLVSAISLVVLLAACTVSYSPPARQDLPEPTAGTAAQQTEAAAAARSYLARIDGGDYDGIWSDAGPALKSSSTRFLWTNMLKVSRKAFTAPTTRTIQGFGFTRQVDVNAPVGEYVLVQFIGKSGKAEITEKVVMQKDAGKWKIVGYFMNSHISYGSSA